MVAQGGAAGRRLREVLARVLLTVPAIAW